MRKIKLIGFASKSLTRIFNSRGFNCNSFEGSRLALLAHRRRFCSNRYITGINGNPFREAVYTVPLTKRYFHATGSLRLSERNYYDILGVPKDAGRDDIRKAFHEMAKKYHPDTNKNNPSVKRKFQEIRDAYETLRDTEKRAQYDMSLNLGSGYARQNSGGRGPENVHYDSADAEAFRHAYKTHFSDSFHKIFSEIFQDEVENFADDIQVELSLSFSEAAKGCTKQLSFDAYIPCESCHGRGHPIDAKARICPTCGGIGRVTIPPFSSTCSSCKGSGRVITEKCENCYGHGVLEGVKEVNVTIPAGVDSGDTINIPKGGNSGGLGATSGNLYIRLKVEDDPNFSRNGSDLHVDATISFIQAMLGGEVEVPTLAGKISLDIPKGVQPGQVLVLRGKGLPKHGLFVSRGDQHVRFCINFPKKVNERQRAILEEFEEEEITREEPSSEESWWKQILDYGNRPKLMLELSVLLLILLLMKNIIL
ncbi:chaperone protein dnaJ 1, mitochondrial-like isoform X1 [Chenopodium quinoa]|uniref:chaperone protein dnaJ 1, mitochondrial-like isoform X1 n=1 Tax=Chenopodium quinoa TaxID=63459 RepID=UPI000B7844C6|nr:chaperone protein dnaJ 1, mitochondrial-like isoform X1 [Chenopodium quinoa]